MTVEGSRVLITGGAGFIGSYIAEALSDSCDVLILDNLSSGKKEYVDALVRGHGVRFARGDILKGSVRRFLKDRDVVIHLASNPDVRAGIKQPSLHFESNVVLTLKLLEAMRSSDIKTMLFTSTSTIYGEPPVVPTPENYGPLVPISTYGATKLASEALIAAYAKSNGWRALIFRLANVVGGRSTHGVTFDFVNKLKKNPKKLEILGRYPGTLKSYVHVSDVVAGMMSAWKAGGEQVDFYNIGSEDMMSVGEIAAIVVEEMGLTGAKLEWAGGVDDGRGWAGDVKKMILSIEKLKRTGWRPRYKSAEAARLAVREMLRKV
jgi:UDP-glucose 4-epimerase